MRGEHKLAKPQTMSNGREVSESPEVIIWFDCRSEDGCNLSQQDERDTKRTGR